MRAQVQVERVISKHSSQVYSEDEMLVLRDC